MCCQSRRHVIAPLGEAARETDGKEDHLLRPPRIQRYLFYRTLEAVVEPSNRVLLATYPTVSRCAAQPKNRITLVDSLISPEPALDRNTATNLGPIGHLSPETA